MNHSRESYVDLGKKEKAGACRPAPPAPAPAFGAGRAALAACSSGVLQPRCAGVERAFTEELGDVLRSLGRNFAIHKIRYKKKKYVSLFRRERSVSLDLIVQ